MAAETFRIEIPIEVSDKTDPGMSNAKSKMTKFDEAAKKVKDRIDQINKTKVQVAIDAVDKATSVISKVGSTVKSITSKVWNVTMKVIDKATAPIRSIINLLRNPILEAGAVLGISFGVSDSIDTYKEFQSTMSEVQAISGATSEQLEQLTAKAKEMGSTTKFTASEAGEAFTYMAMAGWQTEDMMSGIEGILNLAAASGEDLATTSDIVTDALTAFGLSASDSAHFSDVLAQAASSANTTVSGMGETFKYAGSMAGALGYTIEDVALATGLMANAGVKGTMAGTSLNTIMTRLSTNTGGATDAIKKLGVEFYNSDGSARALGDVISELRTATAGMTAEQKTALANTVAGTQAQKGLLAILDASEEDYNNLAAAINNADGAAQAMSETMLDNLEGSLTLLQSAVDGVKLEFGERLAPYIQSFAKWLTNKMPDISNAIGSAMDIVDEKVEKVKQTIAEFTATDEWANADTWGKIKIAWDEIIVEPFSKWWNGTGKQWFADRAKSIGNFIGGGITTGLLALLGIDLSGTISDCGVNIGGAFISGFQQGFDMDKIGEALKTWIGNNKGLAVTLGGILGFNLITGLSDKLGSLTSFLKGFGSKDSDGTSVSDMMAECGTMTVTANIVNVYGSSVNNASNAANGAGTAAKSLLPSLGGAAAGSGAGKLLTSGVGGLLGDGTKKAVSGYLTGDVAETAASDVGHTVWTTANNGAKVALGSTGSSIIAGLGNFGTALGSGASTVGGAAVAGGSSILGIIGGILGLGSAGVDVYQGVKASKEGDSKAAKDEYVSAGTKTGMVATGAGIGAAIGSVVPVVGTGVGAAVGAGVGGAAALISGSKVGKAISDSTDEGGALNNAWQATKGFFKNTVPQKGGELVSAVSPIFTETIPNAWGTMWDGVSGFFTETVPNAWEGLTETVGTFFTETIPEKWGEFWDGVGQFLFDTVPYALGYAVGTIEVFFTETVPEKFGELWDGVSTFFTDTIPTVASDIWSNHIYPFFTETLPTAVKSLWDTVSTFFTDTIPTAASNLWSNHIYPFFTETLPTFFSGLWTTVSTFVTDTLPTWASNIWSNSIVPFFTESIPAFFVTLWTNVTTFVTETIPTWASNIVNNNIVPFFTSTIPGFINSVWTAVKTFVTQQIPSWATQIGQTISGWISDIKGWLSNAWESAKTSISNAIGSIASSFTSGYTDSKGGHAWGGILNAPHLAMVAEDGPEAIIPLSPSKTQRGLDLWMKAGQELGVQPYAEGGIVGDVSTSTAEAAASGGGNTFEINMEVNPSFTIEGGESMDEEAVVEIIKARIIDMVDGIADELAERLARIFANMPVKGGA